MPEMGRPEMVRPEMGRPEMVRPEMGMPEMGRSTDAAWEAHPQNVP
jgi:hypothetical protein